MDISRRTDYAIRLVSALATSDGTPRSVRVVAEEYDVPYAFARSIQHDLSLAGIIKSTRGVNGGMVLVKDPSQMTLLDIVTSMQGVPSTAICAREEDWCPREENCPYHKVWVGLDNIIADYLSSVSISDLLDGKKPKLSPDVI
jgi:Rrf2 family protein